VVPGQPSPTPFPYTTLFRSDRAGRAVGVLEDGQGETVGGIRAAGRGVRLETMPALEDVPAVVLAARARRRLHVHFLPRVLTDIRSEEHTSELQSRFDLVCRL